MVIPGFCPFQSISVDAGKEKIMDKPNMIVQVSIQAIIHLQALQEKFPF